MLLPLTEYVQELATRMNDSDRCAQINSPHTSSATTVRAGCKARTHVPGEEKNQAAAGSATGAGFLATSLATIGVICAPILRQ